MTILENNKKIITTAGMIFMLFFGWSSVFAATIQIQSDTKTVGISGQTQLDVMVDSSNQIINAISGTIPVDSKITVEKIMSGDSVITFWVEKPSFSTETNSIKFSGIIPGGVTVQNGKLFSIIISGSSEGDAIVSVMNPELLLHDGFGTVISTNTKPVTISVSDTYPTTTITDQVEKNVPEKFTITRNRDISIFENNWFIIFSTQDKESGINRYEVCELFVKKCSTEQSPYQLQNQSRWYMTVVRAYDEQENVQYALLVAPAVKITLATLVGSSILVATYVFFFRKTK